MKPWKDQDEMFSLMREKLYTPVVGDILDQMGLVHQFLPQDIRPLRDDMKLAGKAMTVLMTDVYGKQEKPFGYLTEALDQLEKNEIYIAAGGTPPLRILGRAAYRYRQNPGRRRRGAGWLAQGYPAGAGTELAGVQCWLLRTGFQCAHSGDTVPLPHRDRRSEHTAW